MARRTISGSRVAITGASSGVGRALALELAKAEADLVLSARREDRLQALAGELTAMGRKAAIVCGDITVSETRQAIVRAAREQLGGLDILINNAGVAALGPFREADPDRCRRIFDVNFFALIELTRLALPLLTQGRRPMIVNMGSILGHLGLPNMSEYSASKFAIRGFSHSLRAELYRQGIDVLLVSPATIETEIWTKMLEQKSPATWKAARGATPEYVARKIVQAIRKGKHELFPGWPPKLLYWLTCLCPSAIEWVVARRQ